MGRILAIDYGTKRTGIAVTDPLRIVPGGLRTVATHELNAFLADYFSKESVDIVVTDYGVAVNPNRHDLLECLRKADCVPLKTIEELRDIAYSIVGEPDPVEFGDRIVGIIEARDGTIMDVVRQVKPAE